MSSEIQEGFLCPVCVIDLKDPSKLKMTDRRILSVLINLVQQKHQFLSNNHIALVLGNETNRISHEYTNAIYN